MKLTTQVPESATVFFLERLAFETGVELFELEEYLDPPVGEWFEFSTYDNFAADVTLESFESHLYETVSNDEFVRRISEILPPTGGRQ